MTTVSQTLTPTSASPRELCIHCNAPITNTLLTQFCCHGCEAVYNLLKNRGLEDFYELRRKGSQIRRPSSAIEFKNTDSFDYLDDQEFLNLYSWKPSPDSQDRVMEFYLEGVHCAACIWLTENSKQFVPHVESIRLNLADSVATVRITQGGSFAQVAEEFMKVGYRPHPITLHDEHNQSLQKLENRKLLIQLGIAGACAGNIMLLAISLYAGAEGQLASRFRWTSLALFLPVIFYSASPFFKSAWSAIIRKQASIDIPIVLGLLIGSLVSVIQVFRESNDIYFDSLSSLIFLLLSTRYILKRTQQSALNSSHILHFLTPSYVNKVHPKTQRCERTRLDAVQAGDLLQVKAGECFPVDAEVISGESSLSQALLTGESDPKKVQPKDVVFAGTLNLEAPLTIKVIQSGSQTRLGKILKLMEESLHRKAKIVSYADQISKKFVLAVVALSVLSFILGSFSELQEGLNRALAISLVTCPCTFALATPLAFSVAMGRLAQAGILVKGSETLEKLSLIKEAFLDKTGTLTTGQLSVKSWTFLKEEKAEELVGAIYLMELQSQHPIAKAIVRSIEENFKTDLSKFKLSHFSESLGRGITAQVNESTYRITQTTQSTSGTSIDVFQDHELYARIEFSDSIKPDAFESIQRLKDLSIRPWILSGDQQSAVLKVAQELEISSLSCISQVSPEQKCEVIKTHPNSLMVGDGANDAIALAEASVGVAVHSGVEISLRAADVYLVSAGINPIVHLIVVARETMRVIHRNFKFSIIYNAIAGAAALLGLINPLFAAVLMPMSAITVILSSIIGTKKMRESLKRLNA